MLVKSAKSRIVLMYFEAGTSVGPESSGSRRNIVNWCSAPTTEQRHVVCEYQSTLRGPAGAATTCHVQPIDLNQCTEHVFRSVWVFKHESRPFPQLLFLAHMMSPVGATQDGQHTALFYLANSSLSILRHHPTPQFQSRISPHVIGISKERHDFIESASTIPRQVI